MELYIVCESLINHCIIAIDCITGNLYERKGYEMKRTKLRDRALPDYTRGEELFNMISHAAGAAIGVGILSACNTVAALRHNVAGMVTGTIYAISVILLFTMSAVYHGLPVGVSKKVMQVLDHCTIYIMIAGTYTPITVCAIAKENPALGWGGLVYVWVLATLAIILTAIDLRKYRVFSMICYLGIGWSTLFIIRTMYHALEAGGLTLLLAGGVLYSIGSILYVRGRSKRYIHSVFHLFVVAGCIAHFFCIILYVL